MQSDHNHLNKKLHENSSLLKVGFFGKSGECWMLLRAFGLTCNDLTFTMPICYHHFKCFIRKIVLIKCHFIFDLLNPLNEIFKLVWKTRKLGDVI